MSTISREDAEESYRRTIKLLHTLHYQLEQLESGSNTSDVFQGQVATNVNLLARYIQRLQTLKGQLNPAERELYFIKIKKIVEEERLIRTSMERFLLMNRARQIEDTQMKAGFGDSGMSAVDQIRQERNIKSLHDDILSVNRSNQAASEIKDVAIEILGTLRNQNWTLKRIRRRVINIMGTTELTRALFRVIRRRQIVDQIIVYSGMCVVVVLFCVLWYYFKW